MSPLYLPCCVVASLFLQWQRPLQSPGFDPGTFGSQARLLNHTATAVALVLPLKPGVYLPFACKLGICLSLWFYIAGAQFPLSDYYDFWCAYRLAYEKMFGVFCLVIFGQAQRSCPITLVPYIALGWKDAHLSTCLFQLLDVFACA